MDDIHTYSRPSPGSQAHRPETKKEQRLLQRSGASPIGDIGRAFMAASALLMAALAIFVAAAAAVLDMTPGPFDDGYAPLFGDDNLVLWPDGRSVTLKLDRNTGK